MASKESSTQILFQTTKPLNTPGGLGKEIKGNIQGTNILNRLENDYRGKMTDGKMFEDDRIETEAGQRTDAHLTDPSTDRPTNGIRPKNTTASDRKIVQRADSVTMGKTKKMFNKDEGKIECAVGNREISVWQSRKPRLF